MSLASSGVRWIQAWAGSALSARLDRFGQLPLGDALRFGRQIASSLAAATMEQLRSFSSVGLIAGTLIHGTILPLHQSAVSRCHLELVDVERRERSTECIERARCVFVQS